MDAKEIHRRRGKGVRDWKRAIYNRKLLDRPSLIGEEKLEESDERTRKRKRKSGEVGTNGETDLYKHPLSRAREGKRTLAAPRAVQILLRPWPLWNPRSSHDPAEGASNERYPKGSGSVG